MAGFHVEWGPARVEGVTNVLEGEERERSGSRWWRREEGGGMVGEEESGCGEQ